MKKFILFSTLTLILSGCDLFNPFAKIADGYPITPVRLTSDTTTLYMTDYLPSLVGTHGIPDSMVWTDTVRHITAINYRYHGCEISIPVLPNMPFKSALTCSESKDNQFTFRFDRIANNPKLYAWWQNRAISDDCWKKNGNGTFTLTLSHKQAGRSYLRVFAIDEDVLYNDVLIPLENGKAVTDVNELSRHDNHAQILYSLMVDRFANGNRDNDWKINSPEVLDIADYQGGDFAGITQKIEEGWFEDLGINTIWISPISQNPYTAWGYYPFPNGNKYDRTKPYTRFTGYHGYWPVYITKLEERFGTENEFRTMLKTAHEHDMNVVLDYVANHMHIEAPTYVEHPDWHTDSILPDGRRNFELWDEARLTTWFDQHIPTLDLERKEVYEPMTDSAMYWLENYDIDGFRHDACKHIPLCYWRTLGQKIAKRFPKRHIWMIGETYGNPELIGSYVKTGMLPAQFDFNIYHTAIDVLGKAEEPMSRMAEVVEESLAAYGAHHTMGNISGNHDKARFISLAGGALRWDENDKEAGWTRYVGVTPDDADPKNAEQMERAYKAAMLLEVINMTIPGVPCIYQGDEFGAAGANDPDNRWMMRFIGLNSREQQFRKEMQNLIKTRRESMALIYGDYIPVLSSKTEWVFDRVYMSERVRVSINKEDMSYRIEKL